ncbi:MULTISPECIES: HIT family protein [unclassified Rhizobium]|uniref:HIT family protein n=1 Tax=unclassified Rhizobium TaxID=2613769 RepID=UPI000EA84E8D|nr:MULTISPECIES: HIT family protein [unclassified Rhizobium]AYG69671.1 HIT family protein [Rhizobium sp. CCGE531]AYG76046.1 HIT family protein [Rhizobium sp. CCGE532]
MELSHSITETDAWLVSHRANSALPGYLIISAKNFANDLSELSETALRELGPLLALTQANPKQRLNARRVYIGRYGHTAGQTIHFHVIPIYDWVEELFWRDPRYRVLEDFAEGQGEPGTDGAELTLYVWREFCERADPPAAIGPTVPQVVRLLRESMHPRSSNSGSATTT